MSEPILEVRDLRVWYGTEATRSAPSTASRSDRCRRDPRARRRVRLRQVDARPRRPRPAARDGRRRGRGPLRRAQPGRTSSRARCARCAGPELGLIFQEPMTRLNPLITIEDHFLETLRAHTPGLAQDEMRRRVARGARRHGNPADPLQAVPARVLRRDAPADHDRAGPGARAEPGRRRRADHRARRDRRGADPGDPLRPAAATSTRRSC